MAIRAARPMVPAEKMNKTHLEITMPSLIDRLRDSGVVHLGESEWRDIKNRYWVSDQFFKSKRRRPVKIVFLLESPHKEEVCNEYPLAGNSGISVARKMVKWKILPKKYKKEHVSIGQLVRNKCRHVRWLGLMNVSELPLQDEAYDICNYSPEFELLLCRFGKIRKGAKKKNKLPHRRSSNTQKIQEIIICDLADRINQLLECYASNPMFVSCGRFANAALKEVSNKRKKENLSKLKIFHHGFIPHPSRNQWWKKDNNNALANLKSEISRLSLNPKNQRRKK